MPNCQSAPQPVGHDLPPGVHLAHFNVTAVTNHEQWQSGKGGARSLLAASDWKSTWWREHMRRLARVTTAGLFQLFPKHCPLPAASRARDAGRWLSVAGACGGIGPSPTREPGVFTGLRAGARPRGRRRKGPTRLRSGSDSASPSCGRVPWLACQTAAESQVGSAVRGGRQIGWCVPSVGLIIKRAAS